MKPVFLIDENLSPGLASFLKRFKYRAGAVRDVGLRGKSDEEIVFWLQNNNGILITSDLDFGEFFYWRHLGNFGVIILRSKLQNSKAFEQIILMLHHHGILKDERLLKSLVVATESDYRWRKFHE